ncbi:DNA translocase FtsK [Pseudooceanicola sp. HF7]|uniref:DNA translocase FtsK n=1 Tax=Pseudooceanicola sp. HF7 TaxID=2721560 RepID=UPI00143221E6|nr:DNA translocase FtsK [Pseudooceanicola sp. HF7]NIZ10563.1 cell division protein FtsK [Pseudooceanicola sp. HF7]
MAYQTKGRDPLFDSSMQETLRKRGKELIGVLLLAVGLGLAAILISYSPDDPSMMSASDAPVQNWLGRFGAAIAAPVVMIIGAGGWAIAMLAAIWGLRYTLHRPDHMPVGRLVFAPVFIVLLSIYAGTLNTGPGWPHAFGLGGLFGDTALGGLLGLLPLPIDAGIRVLALITGIGSAVLGLFVMGFTRTEFRQGFRLLLIGIVLAYVFLLKILGRGAASTWHVSRLAANRAAARAAESNRARRERRLARRDAEPDWEESWQQPAEAYQPRSFTAYAEDQDDYPYDVFEETGEVGYETDYQSVPQDPQAAGYASEYPYEEYEEEPQPQPETRSFLGRLIRRAEPAEMPEPELVTDEPVLYYPEDDDNHGDERIRAKIVNAVRSSRQRRAVIRKTDSAGPDGARRPRGPKPLVFDPNARRAEPTMVAADQSGLPPEPPVTSNRPAYRPVGAADAGLVPDQSAPMAHGHDAVEEAPFEPAYDHVQVSAHEETAELSQGYMTPPDGSETAYTADPDWAMEAEQEDDSAYPEESLGTPPERDEQAYIPDPLPDDMQRPMHADRAAPASAAPAPRVSAEEPKRVVQPEAPKPTQSSPSAKPPAGFDPEEAKYALPPLSLLRNPDSITRHHLSDEALEENARMLESVLDDYGVKGEIVSVRPGPVVTMYELEPAPGLKASRVIGLADDIARSMSALSARVSTVPGRSVIGIELPNDNREMVVLREILAARDFGDSHMKLPLALGKDIGGESMVANLAKMPHLLIAGTTGSGKSVAINTMILSLLYRLTPEECRLIMIDPKMLELSVYDGIPHLLSPVVTDPKKAVVALKWVVAEMEERYRKMSKMGVRNIDGYNGRVADALAKGEMFSRTVQTGFDDETGDPVFETEESQPEKMPYIVVIVDEMADLMMVAGKEIEACIQRLAQMARASGIHLIMATQRPSVDVITGTIKANFPTRISFQVTSKIDSRTILGEMGAEQLLGMGDMLYMAGGSRITRCHGPFVSDEEVEEIVNYLKGFGPPEYIGGVVDGPDDEKSADIDAVLGLNTGGNTGGEDALYDQAVAIAIKDRKCSTSYIQRKLAIGYNKAARLVEQMEDEGVVSAANHVGKREVLVPEQ